MKEVLKLGLFLFTVSLIAALALALANEQTRPLIEKHQAEALKQAIKEVSPPGASKFELPLVSITTGVKYGGPDLVALIMDEKNQLIGYALKASPLGYADEIELLVGVSQDLKVTGIKIIKMNETPGLGSNVARQEFLGQFAGKSMEAIRLKKDDPKNGQIDAVTGATISSRAVTKGVREVIERSKQK